MTIDKTTKKPIAQAAIAAKLTTESGPTLLGIAVTRFLESVNFAEAYAKVAKALPASAVSKVVDESKATVEALSGKLFAEALDLKDLAVDFSLFVEGEIATDSTLRGRGTLKAIMEGVGLKLTDYEEGVLSGAATAIGNFLSEALSAGHVVKAEKSTAFRADPAKVPSTNESPVEVVAQISTLRMESAIAAAKTVSESAVTADATQPAEAIHEGQRIFRELAISSPRVRPATRIDESKPVSVAGDASRLDKLHG